MAMTMHCDIVSAESEIYSGPVTMLIAAGEMGDLGITPRHQQLLTRLKPGQIELYLQHGENALYYISGGFLEVQPHTVTILADTVVRADDLDEAAAKTAVEEAEKQLNDIQDKMEIAQAQAQLAEALGQLKVINELKRKAGR